MNIDEINREIKALETGQTTFAACEKLSQLYIVRDHLGSANDAQKCEVSPRMDGSEFLSVASGVNVSNLLTVLNEHMDVIKLLHPKEYDTLIQKIRELV